MWLLDKMGRISEGVGKGRGEGQGGKKWYDVH